MVLLRNIGSEDDVIPRINMLCHLLRRKYTDKGEVSCSMGVVFYPRDGRFSGNFTKMQTLLCMK